MEVIMDEDGEGARQAEGDRLYEKHERRAGRRVYVIVHDVHTGHDDHFLASDVPASPEQAGEAVVTWLATHPAIGDWADGRWLELVRA
jgi:hypothetical protein